MQINYYNTSDYIIKKNVYVYNIQHNLTAISDFSLPKKTWFCMIRVVCRKVRSYQGGYSEAVN